MRSCVYQLDVGNYEVIWPSVACVDWVFHLTTPVDIVRTIQKPLTYCYSDVNDTASILQASRQAVVKQCVHTTSSPCYEIPDVFPRLEVAGIIMAG